MSWDRLTVRFADTKGSSRDYSNPVVFFLFCLASSLKAHLRGTDKGVKVSSDVTLTGWPRGMEGPEARSIVHMLRILHASPKWEQLVGNAVKDSLLQIPNLAAAAISQPDHSAFWLAVASLCFIGGDNEQPSLLSSFLPSLQPSDSSTPISYDAHDGSCRAKVLNEDGSARIILVGDLVHNQAMGEFRRPANTKGASCRFCSVPLNEKNTAPDAPSETLVNVCNECIEHRNNACRKVLPCGHPCGGVVDEKECLPCLQPDCASKNGTKQDADSLCSICYIDNLSGAPTVELKCGHFFHYGCVQRQLSAKWNGPRITFGFCQCPLCKAYISHPSLGSLVDPIDKLRDDVQKKAVLRLKYEGLEKAPELTVKGSRWFNDALGFAMHKFAYYLCFKCQKPYYGGNYECAAAADHAWDPSELLCGGCSPIQAQDCPKHGKDYLEFKCRFCCTVAIWFCFGTTHFCEPCHNNNGVLCGKNKAELVQCPCKPKGDRNGLPEKLEGDCPLGVVHPPSGEEFALGCGLCRNIKEF